MQIIINLDERFSRKLKLWTAGLLVASATLVAIAVGVLTVFGAVSIPHTFAPKTLIESAKVNENFAALKTAVEALDGQNVADVNGATHYCLPYW